MPLIKSSRIRSLLKTVVWVAVVQLVLINISAALYAYKFTHFYNERGPAPKQDIFSKTWKLFVGPRYFKMVKQEEPAFPYESFQLKTSDDLSLQGWYSEVDSAKGCVLLFHGISMNKSSLLFEAAAFRDLGYNVLMIDFRAHGQSAGNNSSFGVDETEEVKNAFEFARSKGNKKIILYGMSLGAVVCIKAASEKAVQPDAIIAEMPFGSLQDHIRARAQSVGFSNAAGPFSFFVTFWIGLERGFNGFNHKTTDYAKQVNCPVLLQSGQNDLYVTESQIKSVYKSIGSNKKLVTYPEAGHESLLRADVTRWMNEVDQFLTSLP